MGERQQNQKGEEIVMNCFLCKGDMENRQSTHTVDLDSCIIIIKFVPAMVCSQCGEVWFSGTVAKQLEKIVEVVTSTAITEIAIVSYSEMAA